MFTTAHSAVSYWKVSQAGSIHSRLTARPVESRNAAERVVKSVVYSQVDLILDRRPALSNVVRHVAATAEGAERAWVSGGRRAYRQSSAERDRDTE